MKCPIYGMFFLWNVLFMECSFYEMSYSIYEMSYLCNVPSMKCPTYNMSYLWNVQAMKCSILWNALPIKCPFYEMSYLWNVLSMNFFFYEMSCLSNSQSMILLSIKCLSMKCPNTILSYSSFCEPIHALFKGRPPRNPN